MCIQPGEPGNDLEAPKKTRPIQVEKLARMRASLLASALKTFAIRGYTNTSVRDIADNAGATSGALYYHFESKEALLLELLDQYKAAELNALGKLLAISITNEDIFAQLSKYYGQVDSGLYAGLLLELRTHPHHKATFRNYIAELHLLKRTALGQLIEKIFRQSRRLLPKSAEELAVVLLAVSNGLSLQLFANRSQVRRGVVGDAVVLVLRSLLEAAPKAEVLSK